ncbi:PLP-dependent aminotransferase family protein [Glycomyces sp. NPDC046736]|uniref:aminotransferase-like domain-containing protein n=1 Tax=Glycomyces sp. NPDC046736 TaxID=3155615 RepID=UPI0033EEE258
MVNDSSQRIVAALREWIAQAPPGAKLPSTRALVAEHAASPVTVQKALRALTSQGLVESRPGVGTFTRAARPLRPSDFGWQTAALGSPRPRIPETPTALHTPTNEMIALHSGYPDRELLPERLVRAAFTRAARGAAAVGRPPATGLPELQAWFATELGDATPPGVAPPAPSDVIIVPGSQSGLSSAFRVLVGPGRPLLMESPTYWGAITAAAREGVEVVPIPLGPNGPDPEVLARAFEQTGARAYYAQPNFANPNGAKWSPDLTERVLDVVRESGAFLIEDDWAHEFGIDAESDPVAARDDDGHVVYIRSLTKSVSPAVRVAAVIARGPARERLLADARAEAMYVSGLLQAAALDVVTGPGWRTHLRALRNQLESRRDLLAASLREHVPQAHLEQLPRGGLNLWARLPDTTDLPALVRACRDAGVLVVSGDEWFPAEPTGAYLRLNYSGANPAAHAEATRTLGRLLAS